MRPTLAAALAATALTLTAPPALAHEPYYRCSFESLNLLGESTGAGGYSVLAYGVVAHADADVSITCLVQVNGVEQARTPTGTGTTAAATAGTLFYFASPDDVVEGCAVATVNGREHRHCPPTVTIETPPINEVLYAADEVLCPILGGDVHVTDDLVWDCPPYGG